MSTTSETVTLPAGHTLAVTADAVSSGNVYPFAQRVGDTSGVSAVAASTTVTLGPFATVKRYQIVADQGSLTHVIAPVDYPTLAEAAAAAAALYVPVGTGVTIGDIKIYAAAGAPVDYTDGDPVATGEGEAGIGSLYINTTNGKHYVQGGTKAQPVWKLVTSAT